MKNLLKAGIAKADITPPMGIRITGYYKDRFAEGVLDNIYTVALALAVEDKKVLFITVDNCGIKQSVINEFRTFVSEKTGVPFEGIYVHSTHTHTGPKVWPECNNDMEKTYYETVKLKMADAAILAIQDLKDAKMGTGVSVAPNISFVRRFRMKDGSVKTNPGVNNPDIVAPIGEIDDTVNVIRFAREDAEDIVLINFADHPDTVGGNLISGDWPSLTRTVLENATGVKCILLNGAQGDINHVNVHPKPGDLNGMFMDFDDVSRGYPHAQHMAKVVAGATMQVMDKVAYVDVDNISYLNRKVSIPTNKAKTEAELKEAHRINDLHIAGKDAELPYEGMMLTTVVAEAGRIVALENEPDAWDVYFPGVAVGNVAFVGVPGEPFNGIGKGIKSAEGWDMICVTCLTNGSEGYYPMKDSYEEGGYEARSSRFKAGTAELIIEEGKEILKNLK